MPHRDWDGKRAIVTGASSGIGRELARLLAGRGCRTVLIARRADRLESLARELSADAPAVAVALDLTDIEQVRRTAALLVKEHGPVDVLINNAGSGMLRPFLEQSHEDFDRLMRVHYYAPAALIRAVLPTMLERRRGQIINIGSVAMKANPWGHSGYSAAKAALVSLTRTLATEYGRRGVHFSYVTLGLVRTEFFNQPGYAAVADEVARHGLAVEPVAKRIASLLDRPRLEIVIPRYYRLVDWLNLLCPSLLQRLIAGRGQTKTK